MPLNVNLTPELEAMVRDKVASGLYNSASEVVREALRLMEGQDRMRDVKLEQLRRDLQAGVDSGSGAELDIAAIKRRGRARLKQTKAR